MGCCIIWANCYLVKGGKGATRKEEKIKSVQSSAAKIPYTPYLQDIYNSCTELSKPAACAQKLAGRKIEKLETIATTICGSK